MSDVDWQAIRAEYESGDLSQSAIAKNHGISRTAIQKKALKEGWVAGCRLQVAHKQVQSDTNPTPKKDLSTKDRQRFFLEAYAEQANVMVAARAAGIYRTTVYDWLEHDEDFSFAYNQAKEDAKDVLRAEIYRRGKEGWDESVYEMGVLTKTVRKHSDTLLIFHAKMLMPEYREKQSLEVTTPGAIETYKVRIPDNDRD